MQPENMVYLRIRRYDRIRNRILEALERNGGFFEGIFDLALTCNTTPLRLRRELRGLQRQQIVSVKRSKGRHKTRIERV